MIQRYIKQKITDLLEEIDKSAAKVGVFNTDFSVRARLNRQKLLGILIPIKKISIIDIHKTLHSTFRKCVFFSAYVDIYKIYHLLGHKLGLNKY